MLVWVVIERTPAKPLLPSSLAAIPILGLLHPIENRSFLFKHLRGTHFATPVC